ncbi:MAG: phosphoribosylglycinamide formyltransferase [Candidatus Aenigmarchaeota archaeon]|nr:phosphoribosylglycinamide formyltransferase [Candidatus Aenigmarchaeota archaeon]
MLRIGVLSSTRATDMQALIDSINSRKINAIISVLISDRQDAYALERAKNHNIKAVFIDPKKFVAEKEGKKDKEKSRELFDRQVSKMLDENKVGLILLIGYMRFLSRFFVGRYKNRIMNIHPSLLPKYAGGMDKNVHEDVLKNREKTTGATLHFVDEGADTGPIIMQKEVKIEKNDTADSLKAKVQKAEQDIILKAVDLYSKGRIGVKNGKVVVS